MSDGDFAVHFARGYVASALEGLVEKWPDLMRTKAGRDKALTELTLAASTLALPADELTKWVKAVRDSTESGEGYE
jgi:hypothetical protein